jgi:hypothetical protein
MSSTQHSHKKHTNVHDLAKRLQFEVDLILANVDEKSLFAEFREEEIIDLREGDQREIPRNTLDERIINNISRRHQAVSRSITPKVVKKNIKSFTGIFYYLFKPLQY